jgi:hypothetical protein
MKYVVIVYDNDREAAAVNVFTTKNEAQDYARYIIDRGFVGTPLGALRLRDPEGQMELWRVAEAWGRSDLIDLLPEHEAEHWTMERGEEFREP